MLDISDSMRSAMGMVKIDAKAFIRSARPNDQIAVVAFTDSSSVIYSSNGQMVTVSQSLNETAAAAQAIEALTTGNMTNIGQAIQQANGLIASGSASVKAFVLLSDGISNRGPDPTSQLGTTPPLYVAGLGAHVAQSYFQAMIDKNSASRYYNQPNAYQMAQVFNTIRAASTSDIGLTSNNTLSYTGADYVLQPNVIAGDSDEVQINAVWSDPNYYYTSGDPSGYAINVVLIDPNGATSPARPVVTDAGYVIFNLNNPQPGRWQTLIQYSVPTQIWGTSAGFEFDTQVNLQVDAPKFLKAGDTLRATAIVLDEGKPVEGLTVRAHINRPSISVANALIKHATALRGVRPDPALLEGGADESTAILEAYRRQQAGNGDILATIPSSMMLAAQEDGSHALMFGQTAEAGSYNVTLTVTGTSSATGKPFSRTRMFSTIVL
ncbi:MAG: vWA domain-containing protein [Massilia sp.]